MNRIQSLGAMLVLTMAVLSCVAGGWAGQSDSEPSRSGMPAYHAAPPSGKLPSLVPATRFKSNLNRNAYAAAATIPKILYQLPCYCHCDRSAGHKSLHDCFISMHAASCNVCQREALYAREQYLRGKTLAQIRQGIAAADWADLNISRYESRMLVK